VRRSPLYYNNFLFLDNERKILAGYPQNQNSGVIVTYLQWVCNISSEQAWLHCTMRFFVLQ
jgi:hypothetical protein